jgi:hypothetical protein
MSSRVGVGVVVAVLAALVIVAVLIMTGSPVAAPEPTRTAPTPSPTLSASPSLTPSATGAPPATATTSASTSPPVPSGACINDYLSGETPIVPPRKSGTFAEVALDAVSVGPGSFGTTTRWRVRAFNPTGSPGTFELPLRATIRTSTGTDLAILGYESGPPNAESARVTETVVIDPCNAAAVPGTRQRGKVVLVVHSAPITTGSYVLTLRELKLPEGGTRDEVWNVALTCVTDPGPAGGLNCRSS